jgi:type I restriction enzyme S subunit
MKHYKLRNILQIKNGKDHKNLGDGKIPVFGSGGIMRYADTAIYNEESILLPRKGTLSNIQYVNQPFWTVDTIYYSVINQELANTFFLYNYLKTLDLSRLNSGTGVPSMTFDSYYDLEICLPDLSSQQKIATVLSALDSKIESNNKINAELEAMAKTLYDYWFVQFDFPDENGNPYKSSGGKMVWNNELKRDIPVGWTHGSLLDIADYMNGLPCQKYRPTENQSLRVIKIREMHEGFSSSSELVNTTIPKRAIIEDGDVLFSWSASLEVMIWAGGRGALNQHIFKVTSDKYPKSFYYYQLINYLQHFKMMAQNRKTTMGHITREHLQQSRIILPPVEIADNLHKIVNSAIKKIIKNKVENNKFSKLRDWLLPMLMNGQVKVK